MLRRPSLRRATVMIRPGARLLLVPQLPHHLCPAHHLAGTSGGGQTSSNIAAAKGCCRFLLLQLPPPCLVPGVPHPSCWWRKRIGNSVGAQHEGRTRSSVPIRIPGFADGSVMMTSLLIKNLQYKKPINEQWLFAITGHLFSHCWAGCSEALSRRCSATYHTDEGVTLH